MHAAQYDKSPRLQKTIEFLSDLQWHTTREIRQTTNSEAVHSDIAELRENGFDIPPALCMGKNENGKRIYKYRLRSMERKNQMELAV